MTCFTSPKGYDALLAAALLALLCLGVVAASAMRDMARHNAQAATVQSQTAHPV